MDFSSAVVAGVPLILVVIGLVAYLKKLGVTGNALTIAALIVGLLLGAAYQFSVKAPTDFAGWFALVVYGLGLGLVASGIYDTAKGLLKP